MQHIMPFIGRDNRYTATIVPASGKVDAPSAIIGQQIWQAEATIGKVEHIKITALPTSCTIVASNASIETSLLTIEDCPRENEASIPPIEASDRQVETIIDKNKASVCLVEAKNNKIVAPVLPLVASFAKKGTRTTPAGAITFPVESSTMIFEATFLEDNASITGKEALLHKIIASPYPAGISSVNVEGIIFIKETNTYPEEGGKYISGTMTKPGARVLLPREPTGYTGEASICSFHVFTDPAVVTSSYEYMNFIKYYV